MPDRIVKTLTSEADRVLCKLIKQIGKAWRWMAWDQDRSRKPGKKAKSHLEMHYWQTNIHLLINVNIPVRLPAAFLMGSCRHSGNTSSFCCSDSRHMPRSLSRRSILLTYAMRGRRCPSHWRHTVSVCASTPAKGLVTLFQACTCSDVRERLANSGCKISKIIRIKLKTEAIKIEAIQ